jgi:hypothetical protein
VTITLPQNYVVGATGVLQTESERAFLRDKTLETQQLIKQTNRVRNDSFPPSSAGKKTIRFVADKVHDFAWFADKRFHVLHDTARFASGRTADCWSMFTDEDFQLWKKSASYVRRSLEYYARAVGEYPYPQATAIHSALSAGGGMEYPMITVVNNGGTAKELDEVIAHEIGHNWFYGILGSNEREHPFLDEGVNTYYEKRYMVEYYGSGDFSETYGLPRRLFDPRDQGSMIENGYLLLARQHKDTPPDTHSDGFTRLAYGMEAYMKTALCLQWLERATGVAKLDAAMQEYYRKWQFKHPYPEDLFATLEASGVDAGWFKRAMQTKEQADFALKGVEKSGNEYVLTIEKKQALNAPFPVTALKDGLPQSTRWFPASGEKQQKVVFPIQDADAFLIDSRHATLDVNRSNNFRRTSGLFPSLQPLRFRSLALVQNPSTTTLAVLPWFGWNNYDKTMLGVMFYNAPFPPRKFQFYVAPGYALGSKRLTGLADLSYKIFPGGFIDRLTFGVTARTFDYDYNAKFNYYSKYYRVVPQVRFDLADASRSFAHYLNFRTLFTGTQVGQFDQSTFAGTRWKPGVMHELKYGLGQERFPNPFEASVAVEARHFTDSQDRPAHYVKASFEWKQQFYFKPGRKVSARFFGGYFLENTLRGHDITDPIGFALNPQGFNDYRYDELFFGRSDNAGILSRQVSQTEGGFKAAFGMPYIKTAGNSYDYIMSVNLKADLPQRLPWGIPLKPWFDIGYFKLAGSGHSLDDQLLWSGGFMLEFFKGGLEIYLPVINCKSLSNLYRETGAGNYLKWISWSIRLGNLDPATIIEKQVH